MDFLQKIKEIKPLDTKTMQEAKGYHDDLVKPIGSLGRLEEMAVQLSGITGRVHNEIKKKAIVIMCADNGVYAEGVSTAPQEVTMTQAVNFTKGLTGVAVLAKQGNIDLKVVDIGIDGDTDCGEILNRKIGYGTKNCAEGPAMSKEEMYRALSCGFELMGRLKEEGYDLIGTGEMGICNTTTSSAVISCLCNVPVEKITGMGAGLTRELLERKKKVLRRILDVNRPDASNPFDVLQKVGGFDIAGLVGCFLGAAYYRVPVVIDGVISMAAALISFHINPLTRGFMYPSHLSEEKGYAIAASKIGLRPYFQLEMRLGEGSGCPFTMYLLEAAVRIVNEMATFREGNVDKSRYVDIREEESL